MSLGNSSSAGSRANASKQSTGPMLSPKENIKKMKSSFFGCSTIDENSLDYVNCAGARAATVGARKDCSRNTKVDDKAGDYAIMSPAATRNIPIPSIAPISQVPLTKKSVLVTSNNNPDKVFANTQSKTQGFKPIASPADKEIMQGIKSIPMSFSRQHSAPVEKNRKPSDSAYERLELRSSNSAHAVTGNSISHRIARPNSVNSEKTTFQPLMRPNSANSERQLSTHSLSTATTSGLNECSSLTSSSSTLCSSGTITRPQSSSFLSSGSEYSQTSRPSSVVSVIDPHASTNNVPITSRPSSVSSERELHYASLDLPPCSSSSAATVANNIGNSSTNTSIQNPSTAAEAPSFTYAQIDFIKTTENSSSTSAPTNNKDA